MRTSTLPQPVPVWLIVDASGKTIGAVASKVAHVLRGKHRPSFSPHQLCGDHVIILNAAKLSILPAKAHRKMYYHHTGYLGHLQTTSLEKMMEKKPEDVLQKAVKGMLPSNRLKPLMLKRLHIFKDDQHPYAPQKPLPLDLSTLL